MKTPKTQRTKAIMEGGRTFHICKNRFIEGKRELIIITTYNLTPIFGIRINNPLFRWNISRSARSSRRRNTVNVIRHILRPEIITIIINSGETVSNARIRSTRKSIFKSRTSIIELIIFTRIRLITRTIEIILHPVAFRSSSILNGQVFIIRKNFKNLINTIVQIRKRRRNRTIPRTRDIVRPKLRRVKIVIDRSTINHISPRALRPRINLKLRQSSIRINRPFPLIPSKRREHFRIYYITPKSSFTIHTSPKRIKLSSERRTRTISIPFFRLRQLELQKGSTSPPEHRPSTFIRIRRNDRRSSRTGIRITRTKNIRFQLRTNIRFTRKS